MDVKKAAMLTREFLAPLSIEYFNNGTREKTRDEPASKDHLLWMLDGIGFGYIQHEKAHRWLGYVQGVMAARECIDLRTLKNINKKASE